MTIVTPNRVSPEHLKEVMDAMKVMGAPVIRAVHMGENVYAALEGSHRIMAAYELGLEPIIEEIEYSDETIEVQWDGYDEVMVISEIADCIYNSANNSHIVNF